VSASGKNRRIRVWTLPQGKLKLDFELTASFPLDSVPVLSPDGSWLAAPMEEEYTEDGEKYSLQRGLSVWDLAEGKLSWKDESVRVNGLAASPDGKALAAFVRGVAPEGENRGGRWAPGEEYLTLWAASSGEITWTRGHKDLARQRRIAFSPDGKTILGLEKGKLIRWNRSTGEPIGEMKLQGDTSFPTELKIATDGRRAAVKCALSFTISFLDLEKGIPDGHLDVKQAIGCSAFSPDLERIVCEGKSHPVILDISRPLEATSDDD
jgi:WD40 repeat protein